MPDIRSASRSYRPWLIALALLAVVLLLWWLWPEKPAEEDERADPWGRDSGPVPVRVTEVSQGDFNIELKALGTVTALNTVSVRSRVDGELVKVLFEEGQLVKAGDLLAQIDPRAYQVALQQAEGTLAQNQAQLKNAEIDLARYKSLYAEDSIAKQTLDTQEALVGQYRGTVKNNQAAVAEARLNLDFTRIRAPIDGRLGLRQVDAGNLISSGDTTPLVVITQVKPITVNFTLAENDLPPVLARVRNNEQLLVQAWDRGEKQLLAEGVLHSLDNQIDVATGTVKLKARFDNASESLFPNQFVNVRLRVETRQGATLIPSAALQFGARGTFVFLLDNEDKVQLRKVEVGASSGALTLISAGLKVGERLVLEGTDKLKDGSEVQVIGEPGAVAQPANKGKAEQKHDA
ncbi:MdtA/MuxA family multidrug efflux RND transporter periplasmic adaptor subunit [Aquipseudomonas guryensis]|jgi:membrane fusion protein, multidrug efflux system|uniref:MdtA/MuxA family multidrug efflux RND transporter periplasmic adaptor subunit n=1 Tax=Aquipseudomonas guryensis TaxID=2759165 RepID=A0A7W4DC88_9GAMM|nr:MdtA/MuxA family multidrug efflux RND transporter periplasmic adaptor subunit [Pseudomonas guryensis]MBB1519875.1 MdtA/MuxA family multidrug efflux RND transporter periplasmic adaptor subunit [Pseudomonas guryensis]